MDLVWLILNRRICLNLGKFYHLCFDIKLFLARKTAHSKGYEEEQPILSCKS